MLSLITLNIYLRAGKHYIGLIYVVLLWSSVKIPKVCSKFYHYFEHYFACCVIFMRVDMTIVCNENKKNYDAVFMETEQGNYETL